MAFHPCRFYDATGGRITIGGQDVSKVTQVRRIPPRVQFDSPGSQLCFRLRAAHWPFPHSIVFCVHTGVTARSHWRGAAGHCLVQRHDSVQHKVLCRCHGLCVQQCRSCAIGSGNSTHSAEQLDSIDCFIRLTTNAGRYGRPSATDEEVYEAARAASIHEAIETRFPQARCVNASPFSTTCHVPSACALGH